MEGGELSLEGGSFQLRHQSARRPAAEEAKPNMHTATLPPPPQHQTLPHVILLAPLSTSLLLNHADNL